MKREMNQKCVCVCGGDHSDFAKPKGGGGEGANEATAGGTVGKSGTGKTPLAFELAGCFL